jgi:hypothetical protein
MTLKHLIGSGYLCEELPPPFTSASFGLKADVILKKINGLPKVDELNCVNYMAPKVGIHRRHFAIPHPYAQIKLSDTLIRNWKAIISEYDKSVVSMSKPEIDKSSKRAIVYLDKFENFKEACIIASSTKRYQLNMDISKYFHSIYTHSIPWAIHTKAIAKKNRKLSLWGNQIDTFLRLAQSNQTKGIPVGPDTSRIIAEVIGCEIDSKFENALRRNNVTIVGYRFVDDCRYYFDTLADAELALKEYQKILTDFSLNLNDDKTMIKESPCQFDIVWKQQLNAVNIDDDKKQKVQRNGIKNYFNLLIHIAKEHPKDSVVKYGLKRLLRLPVHDLNIDILESLLYCVSLHETSALPTVFELLIKYESKISKASLSQFILTLINQNIHKGHHYEVAWALWIAKGFKVIIPSSIAQQIIDSRDVISIIILLDLNSSSLVSGSINTTDLIIDLKQQSCLDGELWMLAYEAEIKGWLPISNISGDQFFEILKDNKISFYEEPRIVKSKIGYTYDLKLETLNINRSLKLSKLFASELIVSDY